jgi:hypothetical protein
MRPENEARLKKIRWVSRVLRVICQVILGLFVVVLSGFGLMFCMWGFPAEVYGSGAARIAVVGLLVVLMGLLLKCGYHLYRLLGNYSRGEIFTSGSAEQIRQWGIACVLLGSVKFGILFVPLAFFREYTSPGQGLDWVVNGLIIVGISWFMAMAAEMREEQDLIV